MAKRKYGNTLIHSRHKYRLYRHVVPINNGRSRFLSQAVNLPANLEPEIGAPLDVVEHILGVFGPDFRTLQRHVNTVVDGQQCCGSEERYTRNRIEFVRINTTRISILDRRPRVSMTFQHGCSLKGWFKSKIKVNFKIHTF